MTTTPASSLSVRAVRDLLTAVAPDELEQFDSEFRTSLDEASRSFDLTVVEATVKRWRRLAVSRAHPLTADERGLVDAANEGDESGLYEQREDGSFHPL